MRQIWDQPSFRAFAQAFTGELEPEDREAEILRLQRINNMSNFFVSEQDRIEILDKKTQYTCKRLEVEEGTVEETEDMHWNTINNLAQSRMGQNWDMANTVFIVAMRLSKRIYKLDFRGVPLDPVAAAGGVTDRWRKVIQGMLAVQRPFNEEVSVIPVRPDPQDQAAVINQLRILGYVV